MKARNFLVRTSSQTTTSVQLRRRDLETVIFLPLSQPISSFVSKQRFFRALKSARNEKLHHHQIKPNFSKMKTSLKFREDQKPLIRAKVPLNILGFPFQSGIESGCDSKEFSLNLSTFFESGPSLKFSYRPNDSWNPFSVIVKTGIGAFGSPISAPLSMSAEFNLLGTGNPSFFLHFKPQIGDFTVKKSASSTLPVVQPSSFFFPKFIKLTPAKDLDSDAEGSVDGVETPFDNGVNDMRSVNGLLTGVNAVNSFDSLVNGVEVNATTVLPVRNRACLKFRWGVRFPGELKKSFTEEGIRNQTAGISHRKIPFLVMSKISFEHVAEGDSSAETSKWGPADAISGVRNADVAETFFAVKRQMEALQIENGSLREAVEELRSVIGSGIQDSGKKSVGGKNDRRSKKDVNASVEMMEKDSIGSKV